MKTKLVIAAEKFFKTHSWKEFVQIIAQNMQACMSDKKKRHFRKYTKMYQRGAKK